ncbi:MAG: TetR/AcrR family transcriptional regulator [Candidatus Promineifilaceae bacterium]|nr:TetR/AcrR family transcriptional regulator [Candidatus Promineifilaceae bacterium]
MTRTVKPYDERHTEFLDVAQRLFYSQGFDNTSVGEIVAAVGVAKGTFYHYFDSKSDLLSALVERVYAQQAAALEPLVADEGLSAPEKLERLFAAIGNWKAANRDFVLQTARIVYRDENALLRARMTAEATTMVAPLYARIIRQGVEEGAFDVAYPEETAEIVLQMGLGFSDAFARALLKGQGGEMLATLERRVAAYERSVERVLGAPAGSLTLMDVTQLRIWFM